MRETIHQVCTYSYSEEERSPVPLSERNDVTYLACIMLHLLAAQVRYRVWHVWHVGMDESTPITAAGVQRVFTKPVNSTSSKPNTLFFFSQKKVKSLGQETRMMKPA